MRGDSIGFTMADVSNDAVQPTVLHIAGSPLGASPEALAVEKWIEQSGMGVSRCPHVYLGLAHTLGDSSGELIAIVVQVEDLSPGEFEFFSLVAQTRRNLPVLVYGSRRPELVVRAMQSGATGLATRELVLALGARCEQQTKSNEPAIAQPPAAIPTVLEPPKTMDANMGDSAAQNAVHTERIDIEPKEDADRTESARVPWLRYSDGPERQRPTSKEDRRGSPSIRDAHDAQTSNGSPPDDDERRYEPLLTEHELAALLGDDLDEAALQEREMLTGEGELPENGTR